MNKYIYADKAIPFVLAGKGISFIVQPITLFLIATYFTGTEQGYYYTFTSIIAASILLELGLSMILTQFASHEFAALGWEQDGKLIGDSISLSRLFSLLRQATKWYVILSIIVMIVFIPFGILFMHINSGNMEADFIIPWIIFVIFYSLNLLLCPFLSIMEGCEKLADVQKLKLFQLILGTIIVWIVIISKGKLLAASSLVITNFIIAIYWISKKYRGLLLQLRNMTCCAAANQISWKKEILPIQWKISISWICGYFSSQLYIPLLFRYQNATVAGQMGMSLYLSNAVMIIGIVWVYTKYPLFGALIKKKEYSKLDKIALENTKLSLCSTGILSIMAFFILSIVKLDYPEIGARILSLSALGVLLFSSNVNIVITTMSVYLRAHKEEPFMVSSIIHSTITIIATYITAKYYSADIMAYSIATINVMIMLPIITYIFITKRTGWHGNRI